MAIPLLAMSSLVSTLAIIAGTWATWLLFPPPGSDQTHPGLLGGRDLPFPWCERSVIWLLSSGASN
ncbi:MAG: hypothetical protein U0401_16825 [Anaerolineae bacterium]